MLCSQPADKCGPVPRIETGKLQVVTTILPVHALTLAVAGDHAEVRSLLSSAAAAHDFQMTPKERRLIENAGLVILNGLGMESWLERTLKDFSRIPRSKQPTAVKSDRWKWAAAALLLPVLALAVMEVSGLTHLFHGQQPTPDPIKSEIVPGSIVAHEHDIVGEIHGVVFGE